MGGGNEDKAFKDTERVENKEKHLVDGGTGFAVTLPVLLSIGRFYYLYM